MSKDVMESAEDRLLKYRANAPAIFEEEVRFVLELIADLDAKDATIAALEAEVARVTGFAREALRTAFCTCGYRQWRECAVCKLSDALATPTEPQEVGHDDAG